MGYRSARQAGMMRMMKGRMPTDPHLGQRFWCDIPLTLTDRGAQVFLELHQRIIADILIEVLGHRNPADRYKMIAELRWYQHCTQRHAEIDKRSFLSESVNNVAA